MGDMGIMGIMGIMGDMGLYPGAKLARVDDWEKRIVKKWRFSATELQFFLLLSQIFVTLPLLRTTIK